MTYFNNVVARDITMEGPVTVNMTSVTQSDVCEFTLGMWVKVETQGNQAEFEVFRDETGPSLRLQLSSDIQINTERYTIDIQVYGVVGAIDEA